MKIFKLIFVVLLLAVIGGFGYFAVSPPSVTQTQITKEIPHDKLFANEQQ